MPLDRKFPLIQMEHVFISRSYFILFTSVNGKHPFQTTFKPHNNFFGAVYTVCPKFTNNVSWELDTFYIYSGNINNKRT